MADNRQQQQAPAPPSFGQATSEGLLEASGSFFGSAVAEAFNDPSLAAPFQRMGQRASEALKNRWYQKEFEDFKTAYIVDFKAKAERIGEVTADRFDALNQGYYIDANGAEIKITPGSEESIRMARNMERDSLMSLRAIQDMVFEQAGPYAGNPYISQFIERLTVTADRNISEITGGGNAVAAEADIAGVLKNRAEAELKGRLPADTAGASPERTGDIHALLKKHGGPNFLTMLGGGPLGEDLAGTQIAEITALKTQQLNAKYNNQLTPAELNIKLLADGSRIRKWAAGKYMEDTFPVQAAYLKANPKYADYFMPLEKIDPVALLKRRYSPSDKIAKLRKMKVEVMDQLERIVSQGDKNQKLPENIDETLEMVIAEGIDIPLEQVGDPAFRAELRKKLIQYVKDNWEKSEIASSYFTKDVEAARQKRATRRRPRRRGRGAFRRNINRGLDL